VRQTANIKPANIYFKGAQVMSSEKITLKEVDEVCITILMDNTVDLLMADRNIAQRFHVGKDRVTTIAEHGFSALVRVRCGDKQETVLLDTGISPGGCRGDDHPALIQHESGFLGGRLSHSPDQQLGYFCAGTLFQ
jgi:hypothetical protein